MDHIPSFSAQIKNLESKLERTLTREEKTKLQNDATAMAVPREVHRKTRTYAGKNSAKQIEQDSRDLCNAQCLDLENNRQ